MVTLKLGEVMRWYQIGYRPDDDDRETFWYHTESDLCDAIRKLGW